MTFSMSAAPTGPVTVCRTAFSIVSAKANFAVPRVVRAIAASAAPEPKRNDRQLERDGLIVRQVGSGTFVADPAGQGRAGPGTGIGGIGDASPSDIMEVRLLVEPGMGELAVLRATQSDLDTLQKCLDRGEAARSWREFERWDAEFHEALALTTKNRAVIDILNSINRLRSLSSWGELKKKSLTPARRKIYERQHRAILTALTKRDSAGAQKTIRQHLLAVRHNLIGY